MQVEDWLVVGWSRMGVAHGSVAEVDQGERKRNEKEKAAPIAYIRRRELALTSARGSLNVSSCIVVLFIFTESLLVTAHRHDILEANEDVTTAFLALNRDIELARLRPVLSWPFMAAHFPYTIVSIRPYLRFCDTPVYADGCSQPPLVLDEVQPASDPVGRKPASCRDRSGHWFSDLMTSGLHMTCRL